MDAKPEMPRELRCVADVDGPWVDPDFESGLIGRCKRFWKVPAADLPDVMVATYLNQRMGGMLIADEAERRLASGRSDGTELYDGQLAAALRSFRAAGD